MSPITTPDHDHTSGRPLASGYRTSESRPDPTDTPPASGVDALFAKYAEDRAKSYAREKNIEENSPQWHLFIAAWMYGYVAGCEDSI